MRSLKKIIIDFKSVGQVKGLMNVYEQVTATKMQVVRKSVEISQVYFRGLAKIAEEVALDLSSFNPEATRSAVIFLSADQSLYGDIIEKTMIKFVNFIKDVSDTTDVYVVGKVGQELLKKYAPNLVYKKMDVEIDREAAGENFLKMLIPEIGQYKKVTLFYAEFKSLANQEATSLNISGEDVAKTGVSLDKDSEAVIRLKNIYEPNVSLVGEKFAKEISMSILDQSVKENQLAKYAARLMYLDSSISNIDKKLGTLNIEKRRVRRKSEQKKQSERVSRVVSLGRFV